MCTSGLGLFADEERRETGLEGLEPFGLAGFRRIWGHVGLHRLVGAFLGGRNEARVYAKRAQHGGSCGQARRTGGMWRSPAQLVRRYALTDALVVYSDAAGLPKGFIAMRVYCAG